MTGSAGCCRVEVTDDRLGVSFPLILFYPTDAAEEATKLGPYEVSAVMNAPPAEGVFPLVIVSHGKGSTPLVYRSYGLALARNGYVAALPEHPFNNSTDNSWDGTIENLIHRPRHISLAMDWVMKSGLFGSHVLADRAAVIGHSMGGYAALAVAGGKPMAAPWESPSGTLQPVEVETDERIKVLVLLAPATPWLRAPRALADIRVPVLLFAGAQDESTPLSHSDLVANGVADPSLVDYRVIEGAGHYAFLSPFPPAMVRPAFPPSQDPPGFDRTAFHALLMTDIIGFLDREFRAG